MNEAAAGWRDAQRVLCVRLDQLGDVLMTTPALRALKALPAAPELVLLGSRAGLRCADRVAELDGAIEYAAPWVKATPAPDAAADRALIDRLRRERFGAAVIFTVYTQSALPAALLCLLAEIPLRLAHARENPYHLLTDWVREPEPEAGVRHEVRRQLDLVAAVGAHTPDERLSLRLAAGEQPRMRARLAAHGIDLARRWVALHPGATAPSRRYPEEQLAAAARGLAARGWQVVVLGGDEDRAAAGRIAFAAGRGACSLAGATTLDELIAAIALAPVLVANNSGPAHVAAAVGTPVVDLYALTNPQHTPWQVPCRVLSCDVPCRGCAKSVCPESHHLCLRGIEPAEVVDAVESLWSDSRSSQPTTEANKPRFGRSEAQPSGPTP